MKEKPKYRIHCPKCRKDREVVQVLNYGQYKQAFKCAKCSYVCTFS